MDGTTVFVCAYTDILFMTHTCASAGIIDRHFSLFLHKQLYAVTLHDTVSAGRFQ